MIGTGVTMRGITICIIAFVIVFLFIGHAGAKEGYSIETDVDGTSWGISRSTQTIDFSVDGIVSGSGNFSRNNRIKEISGLSYREKSSAVRGGNLSMEDSINLVAREGPVSISYNLESIFVEDEEKGRSKIAIYESWTTYFNRYNKIDYFGPGIRTSERYYDNGEIASTYSEAWDISKESTYGTSRNRTVVFASVFPGKVTVDRYQNKTSAYVLDLSSIGSLTRIDLTSTKPNDENEYDVSEESISRNVQEYSGSVDTKLIVTDYSSFSLNGNDTFSGNGNYTFNGNGNYTNNYLCFGCNDEILIGDGW